MPYSEVKRHAQVYQLQDEFVRLQSQGEDATIIASTYMAGIHQNPEKISPSDLQSERFQVQKVLAALYAQDQLAVQLQKRYEAYLATGSSR